MPETNGTNRLDRIERALELLLDDHIQFREEHKKLLTAQVLLTDRMDRLTQAQLRTDEKLGELADKLNGLIGYVAGLGPPRKP
jgi:hypothetical protein